MCSGCTGLCMVFAYQKHHAYIAICIFHAHFMCSVPMQTMHATSMCMHESLYLRKMRWSMHIYFWCSTGACSTSMTVAACDVCN